MMVMATTTKQRAVQHERLNDKPFGDAELLLLEDKGVDNEPPKEEQPLPHEHKMLGDDPFEYSELLRLDGIGLDNKSSKEEELLPHKH